MDGIGDDIISFWGQSTKPSIRRPIENYAAPTFVLLLKPRNWQTLQRALIASLRVITGCHSITTEYHIHQETHPVMLATKYAFK